jgi:hypothetical protein
VQPPFHPSFDQRFAGSLAGDLIQIIIIISRTFVGVHPRRSDDDTQPTHKVTRRGRLGCRFDEIRKVLRGLRQERLGPSSRDGGGCRDSGQRHLPLRFEVRLGVAELGCWGASGSAC